MSSYAAIGALAGCTEKQIQVLSLLERGYSLRQTAYAMDLHFTTVQGHRDSALKRIMEWKDDIATDEGDAA